MADLCFICNKSLSEGDSVNVVRGLLTLKTASIARNDGHLKYLNTLTSVNVHTDCRKEYVNKNSIAAFKRRLEEDKSSPSSHSPRKKRNETFDFKKLCIFCGQAADEAAEMKKIGKYKRRISKVSTLEFRDNVIKRAEERDDLLGKLVKDRIFFEHDLVAVEAKYHTICYTNFLNRVPTADKKPRQNDKVSKAMEEIFFYIENNEDAQFTLKELKGVPTEYVPDDKTIISKLKEKYSTDMMITAKAGSLTIISLCGTPASILSKAWDENEKSTSEEERMRVVEAAAAIIREDIRSSVVETTSHPPPSKMLDDVNEGIPKTLSHFMEEVVMKNKEGKTDQLKTKCTSLSHAIMTSMREQSLSSNTSTRITPSKNFV